MFRLSDNYYHRKCYLEREQVPTQSVMKKTMSPPLANIYFKSMTPKLKVLAGLEPPLKGGGTDWYVPPKDLLEGKAIMRPVKHEYITKFGFDGIAFLGQNIVASHHRRMEEEKRQALLESDMKWKEAIDASCRKLWNETSTEAAKQNTRKIRLAYHQFTTMYSTSITKLENLLFDTSVKEITRTRESTFKKMQSRYETLLKQQATMLYERYAARLMAEKANLKAEFVEKIEESFKNTSEKLHDIHYEKHITIEKLRNLLECQNLACQVYVALKEREECKKEMELSEHKHNKKMKVLKEQIANKDFEILIAKEREWKHQKLKKIWQKKVCEIVKKFQMFVAFSLKALPEQAEFFLNMEKLMMLQISEVLDNPDVESIFVSEEDEEFCGRDEEIQQPQPFFLFCDKGYKPDLDPNLCPKHCTSSASQLPVIVVNKRYIYAACDNIKTFTDKVTQYVNGHRGDEKDFEDYHAYKLDVPIKVTTSKQIQQLKLESSVLQILQGEFTNIKNLPIECCVCKIPYCFCSPLNASKIPSTTASETRESPSLLSLPPGEMITRLAELTHEREPKWESYMNYVIPKNCKCSRTAKKHLEEHLPPYMRLMSVFDKPDLPHYEPCSVATLKAVVKKAQGKRTPPEPAPPTPSRTRTVATQYSDPEFDLLCTCFSGKEIKKIFEHLINYSKMFDDRDPHVQRQLVTGTATPSLLSKRSFVTQRVMSLKNLLDNTPELEEIFRKRDCDYK